MVTTNKDVLKGNTKGYHSPDNSCLFNQSGNIHSNQSCYKCLQRHQKFKFNSLKRTSIKNKLITKTNLFVAKKEKKNAVLGPDTIENATLSNKEVN